MSEYLKDRITLVLVGWGLFSALFYLMMLAFGNGEEWTADATYLPYDGSIVISFIVLLLVVKFYGTKAFEGKVWSLILIGLSLWMVAEVIWGLDVLLYNLNGSAVPAVLIDNTDYPFLAGYIFMALGFVYKAFNTPSESNLGKAFIVFVLAGTLLIVSAFLVLLPTMETSLFSESEKFFLIAYIVLDIVLFGLGLAIALYWGTEVSKGWHILAAGLLCMMIADVGYTALDLRGIYFDGSLIELAWVAAYLLIGLAANYQKKLHESFM